MKNIYEKIFGSQNDKVLNEIQPIIEKINSLEAEISLLTNEQLQAKTAEFKARLKKGESLDSILPEAFATVRETGKRIMGMRHYDVQLIGGIALHRGMISEMRTGEGKTLVATLPVYLNALEGKGVHVITVNDYLAKRDAVWMAQIYDFLGLSVGIIQGQRVSFLYDSSVKETVSSEDDQNNVDKEYKVENEFLRPSSRQEAYSADITYGTNNEFGFDYLRDNMVQNRDQMVMRPGNEMHYAVIDEIDSILIDEARTPLIISAPAGEATDQYYTFAKLVNKLQENEDYNVDEKLRSATLSDAGITKLETSLGVDNIYAKGGIRMVHHIEQALKAQVLFQKDKDYVVEDGEVVIIDEFTGRKMPGRRYSEGLHQAIEAKESVKIQQESRTLATITFQNFFRMYTKLSGMTGTAATEEEEFRTIYQLDVLVIPTNKPDARIDNEDQIYKTREAKNKAIIKQIKACQEKRQPILIGTISVDENERLSRYLTMNGIDHQILNAKNHEREGQIIAEAGRPGAVTLATNMAGRGVDIKLGGASQAEKQVVLNAGGLFVLGTERHESRRIDNQLRGRAARQGDPGETLFVVSTDDDLMRIFAGDRLKSAMTRLNVPEHMPIEQRMITRMLETAQKKVESHNYDIRKHLLNYDDILNKQRHVIYKKRRDIIDVSADGEISTSEGRAKRTLREIITRMIEQEVEFIVSYHTNEQQMEEKPKTASGATEYEKEKGWNIQEIYETINTILPLDPEDKSAMEEIANQDGDKFDDVKARDAIIEYILKKATAAYDKLEEQVLNSVSGLGEAANADSMMHDIERQILLRAIDGLWVDHLVQMNYLRTGIGLRGYGQRDPLIEYKRESFTMFNQLQSSIQKEVVYSFFKVGLGLQLAPSVMADDNMVLQGSQKTSDAAAQNNMAAGSGVSRKQKMSKKERRKLKREGN